MIKTLNSFIAAISFTLLLSTLANAETFEIDFQYNNEVQNLAGYRLYIGDLIYCSVGSAEVIKGPPDFNTIKCTGPVISVGPHQFSMSAFFVDGTETGRGANFKWQKPEADRYEEVPGPNASMVKISYKDQVIEIPIPEVPVNGVDK